MCSKILNTNVMFCIQLLADSLIIPSDYVTAVSYTHLDVYKRQIIAFLAKFTIIFAMLSEICK